MVFNRSIRGECNMRVMETAASGALLFQEMSNEDVSHYFQPGHECVFYSDEDLEAQLEHYLTDEEERRTLAEAARQRVAAYRFETLWNQALDLLTIEWPKLQERAGCRLRLDEEEDLLGRTWQALSAAEGSDSRLIGDLRRSLEARPHSAVLFNALGVVRLWREPSRLPLSILSSDP